MSHSTVLVIGDNYESQLEPFDEGLEVTPHKDYLSKESVKSMKAHYKVKTLVGLLIHMKDWSGCKGGIDGKGLYQLSRDNPNSKWDWYQLGGRWSGYFTLKKDRIGKLGDHRAKQFDPTLPDLPPGKADQARKGDIDWKAMAIEQAENAQKWWEEFKSGKGFWMEKTGITKETFIKKHSKISTFAVLKDGEWFEEGDMGWWGMVRNEKNPDQWQKEFDKLIRDLPDDTLLSVVDVHI